MNIDVYKKINLEIIAHSKNKEERETTHFTPMRCEDYTVPEFKIPDSRKKECTREKLSKVLSFIDLNKLRRYSDCCTIMPIPTTEKRLLSVFGNQKEVSRGIYFMEQLGLIEIHDSTYQYNAFYSTDNHSKTYKYYIENEVKVKEYCTLNNINKVEVKNSNKYRTIVDTFKIDSFDNSQVRFGEVHLLKPDNWSVREFEEYVEAVIYNNYPDLDYYQLMADYINETYYEDYPDFRIRYKINFEWNKGNKAINNIKIRATNSLVSAKKDNNNYSTDFKGKYKYEILDKYKLNLSKDIKSSVPRITTSFNNGYWITEDIDIYYLVYREVEKMIGNVINIEQYITHSDFYEMRDDFKNLHLRTYFDKVSCLGRNTCHAMGSFRDKNEVYEAMMIYRSALERVEGPTFGNEIFYHESNIYMEVLKELLDEGYFVWLVYDSWYARKEGVSQEEYEKHVSELVEEKANKYIEVLV